MQLGGSTNDPDYPGFEDPHSGQRFELGDKLNNITKPAQLVRLCAMVVQQHQYAKFSSPLDGPRVATYFMIDAITANMIYARWKVMDFSLRRKLLRAIRRRGPIHVLCMFAQSRKAA